MDPAIRLGAPVAGCALSAALDAAAREALRPEAGLSGGIYDLQGMSGRRYRRLINELIRRAPVPRYLEVGVRAGSTLCAAIAGNGHVQAVAIDDWPQFGGPRDAFRANLARFHQPPAEIRVVESDFRKVAFADLGRFNIYLFDGPHEEADHHDGLARAMPALDDRFILVVDDWNWPAVRQGTCRAVRALGLRVLHEVEIRSTLDDTHPPHCGFDAAATDWHNGYWIAVLDKWRREPGPWRRLRPPRPAPVAPAALAAAEAHAAAPQDTEALALVTFHALGHRLPHLARTLAAFEAWPSCRRAAVVVTNSADPEEIAAIRTAAPPAPRPGFALEVVSAPPAIHPYDLPWAQKPLLRDHLLAPGESFTHVVSLEDDIALGPEAFLSWLRHRPLLAPHGLVPSFLRVEFRAGDPTPYATDAIAPNDPAGRARLRAGGRDLVALDNPYCAAFVMDRALAAEYAASPAFAQGASMGLCPWFMRERAAMGLCFVNVPPGFAARHVVPIDDATGQVAPEAWIVHLAGTYAADPGSPFAKIPAATLFRQPGDAPASISR